MNSSAKGARLERRSRALLEGRGYTVLRSAASKGPFDLCGIGDVDIVLVQCKANRPPGPAERAALKSFPCAPNCRREIHVWVNRAGVRVTVL